MPKLQKTEQQKKDLELQALIEGKMIRQEKNRKTLASKIRMPYSTLCEKLRHPEQFNRDELIRIFAELKFTDEEKAVVW